jgi:hypothetical protein
VLAGHLAIQIQRERASIPKVGLLGCFSLVKKRKEEVRSLEEILKTFWRI